MTSGKSGKWLELQILEQRHHVAPRGTQMPSKELHPNPNKACSAALLAYSARPNVRSIPNRFLRTQKLAARRTNANHLTESELRKCDKLGKWQLQHHAAQPALWRVARGFWDAFRQVIGMGSCLADSTCFWHMSTLDKRFFHVFSGQVSCAWQSPCAKKIWEESLQPSQVKLKACDAVG